ncbi:heme biosynthesis protein HemY [Ottowia thiooxydans]|uniref:heme biosynthesis protein HemY n=1 Tax=Ottowia thiooxydans TaxID=219182 RepID=UPI000420504F|nr:heme biosynthesis HemY N-terminal domain-containing protein [Ottowia thiooxydans]
MRAALWLVGLFAAAVALALFAGDNQGTVTIFWPPHRVDLSANLVLVCLVLVFVLIYAALRALAAVLELPRQARRWRAQQRERAANAQLLDSMVQLSAGRYLRARKAAEDALAREQSMASSGERLPQGATVRALAHLSVAASAHSLQDHALRDSHLQQALEAAAGGAAPQELREGILMRAARWALDDHDPSASLNWLEGLPQGASRRTLALRIKLKAARQARQSSAALETARLLAKHRAFSPDAARSLLRSLASELIDTARDPAQLKAIWASLDPNERAMPELALRAAQRMMTLGGESGVVREWLQPVWEQMLALPEGFAEAHGARLIRVLEAGLDQDEPGERDWLARIEAAQQANPRDPTLQYLAGMACLQRQLWGRAHLLLSQAARQLRDGDLRRSAWRALAELAEQKGDVAAASDAWKRAAQG